MVNKFDWQNKELLLNLINDSITQTEVLKKLGLTCRSGNYQTLLKYVNLYDINIDHFNGRKVAYEKLKRSKEMKQITNSEYFTKGVVRKNASTKSRILKYNLKKHVCSECNCPPEWNNKILNLQLDHINGDTFDNTLENLRFLCPNCHSQTATFGGSKKLEKLEKKFSIEIFESTRKAPLKEEILINLKKEGIRKSASYFKMSINNFKQLCNHYEINLFKLSNNLKIDWPIKEDLQKLILNENLTNLSNIMKVTANAIKRHVRKNNLFLPTDLNKAYWIKNIENRIAFEDLILENGYYKLKPQYNIKAISVL